MATLQFGATGPDVVKLQIQLEAKGFPPGLCDGQFADGTLAAVKNFQRSEGLLADGVVGPQTWQALDVAEPAAPSALHLFTATVVCKMFPASAAKNIQRYLPGVLQGLERFHLTDATYALMALATIRAEIESFEPAVERISKYNTTPGGHPFNMYDNRKDLGNRGVPDGARYCGRGYVQLTGRDNYLRYGKLLDLDLDNRPELAASDAVAGDILAAFLSEKKLKIKTALLENDLARARRYVNGGSHGLDRFADAYTRGQTVLEGLV